jgi:tRNA1(Val) A37 N6-methylase TrmN6
MAFNMNTAKSNSLRSLDYSVGTMETTCDKFHSGAFEVIQPSKRGNRSGMDALLLAAAVSKEAKGVLADLGAGAGVAGFATLNLNENLELLAVEKNNEMADLARQSLLLPGNVSLRERSKIIEHDVTAGGVDRLKAGLGPDSVDHVIMNPPYNTDRERPPRDTLKAEAFMMAKGGIDSWFRTAAAITKPGGTMTIIYRTENLGELLACSQGRFGGLEIMPIHSRAGEAAKRIIAKGTRASRAPVSILPGFVVHENDGQFTPQADAIFKGESRLDFASKQS